MPDNSTQTPRNTDNPDISDGLLKPTWLLSPKGDPQVIQAWKTILRDLEANKENLPPEVYDLEKANAQHYLKEEERYHVGCVQHRLVVRVPSQQ